MAVKDVIKGTCFNFMDEMLPCLYYIYEKSQENLGSKKKPLLTLGKLSHLMVLRFKLVRASGSYWISHKIWL